MHYKESRFKEESIIESRILHLKLCFCTSKYIFIVILIFEMLLIGFVTQ